MKHGVYPTNAHTSA